MEKFNDIKKYYMDLNNKGPKIGYRPETSKSILVVSKDNEKRARDYFKDINFQIQLGSRYLGGFIGDENEKVIWIKNKVNQWKKEY